MAQAARNRVRVPGSAPSVCPRRAALPPLHSRLSAPCRTPLPRSALHNQTADHALSPHDRRFTPSLYPPCRYRARTGRLWPTLVTLVLFSLVFTQLTLVGFLLVKECPNSAIVAAATLVPIFAFSHAARVRYGLCGRRAGRPTPLPSALPPLAARFARRVAAACASSSASLAPPHHTPHALGRQRRSQAAQWSSSRLPTPVLVTTRWLPLSRRKWPLKLLVTPAVTTLPSSAHASRPS